MLDSTDRIQTSHAGSLPRTDALIAANAARADSRKAVLAGADASPAPAPADDGLDAVLGD
ncbi:epoxyalkane--coenzyme M transferase, partial [Clavibacter lycopersici]